MFPDYAALHPGYDFEHYKDLDEGKWVRVGGWAGTEEAKAEILASMQMFKDAPEKPNF